MATNYCKQQANYFMHVLIKSDVLILVFLLFAKFSVTFTLAGIFRRYINLLYGSLLSCQHHV